MTQDELDDLIDRLGDVLHEVFEAGVAVLTADEKQAGVHVIDTGAGTLLFEVRSRVACPRSVRCRIANETGAITLFDLVHGQPPMRAQLAKDGKAN
jgi:hypothetical protein